MAISAPGRRDRFTLGTGGPPLRALAVAVAGLLYIRHRALLAAVAFRVFSFCLPALAALLSVATLSGLRERLQAIAQARRAPLSARASELPAESRRRS